MNETRQIVLTSDSAKVRCTTATGIRRIELGMIEPVEELGPELGAKPFVRTKFSVLEEGKIEVLYSVAAYVRMGAFPQNPVHGATRHTLSSAIRGDREAVFV